MQVAVAVFQTAEKGGGLDRARHQLPDAAGEIYTLPPVAWTLVEEVDEADIGVLDHQRDHQLAHQALGTQDLALPFGELRCVDVGDHQRAALLERAGAGRIVAEGELRIPRTSPGTRPGRRSPGSGTRRPRAGRRRSAPRRRRAPSGRPPCAAAGPHRTCVRAAPPCRARAAPGCGLRARRGEAPSPERRPERAPRHERIQAPTRTPPGGRRRLHETHDAVLREKGDADLAHVAVLVVHSTVGVGEARVVTVFDQQHLTRAKSLASHHEDIGA